MKSWINTIQNNYENQSELEKWNDIYEITKRCGYKTINEMWADNPVIGGSGDPKDFGIASNLEIAMCVQSSYEEALTWSENKSDYTFTAKSCTKNLADIFTFINKIDPSVLKNIINNNSWQFCERFGHDFALTRNHHGDGFWSREEYWGDKGDYLTFVCQSNFSEVYIDVVDEEYMKVDVY